VCEGQASCRPDGGRDEAFNRCTLISQLVG
jgi:hypothetical protein